MTLLLQPFLTLWRSNGRQTTQSNASNSQAVYSWQNRLVCGTPRIPYNGQTAHLRTAVVSTFVA